jgi:hypothetical protein
MNSLQCAKCLKKFTTKSNFTRHQKRKTPCVKIGEFKCEKCLKIFSFDRNLQRHKNRKFPCQKIIPLEGSIAIEIEKEKTKRLELKFNKSIELENIKKENRIEINKSKQMITNNITNNIQINAPTINVNVYNHETTLKHIDDNILDEYNIHKFLRLTKDLTDTKEYIIKILALTYNNDNFPDFKNLCYFPPQNKFYIINNENNWKETDFENIRQNLMSSLAKISNKYLDDHKKIQEVTYDTPDEKILPYFRILGCSSFASEKIKNKKDLKKYAESALSEELSIPEEDLFDGIF